MVKYFAAPADLQEVRCIAGENPEPGFDPMARIDRGPSMAGAAHTGSYQPLKTGGAIGCFPGSYCH